MCPTSPRFIPQKRDERGKLDDLPILHKLNTFFLEYKGFIWYNVPMKTFRILLHITLVTGIILLMTQKYWVEPLTNYLVEHFYVLPTYSSTQ